MERLKRTRCWVSAAAIGAVASLHLVVPAVAYAYGNPPLGEGQGVPAAGFIAGLTTLRTDFLTQLLGPAFFYIGSIIIFALAAGFAIRFWNLIRRAV